MIEISGVLKDVELVDETAYSLRVEDLTVKGSFQSTQKGLVVPNFTMYIKKTKNEQPVLNYDKKVVIQISESKKELSNDNSFGEGLFLLSRARYNPDARIGEITFGQGEYRAVIQCDDKQLKELSLGKDYYINCVLDN